MLLHIITKPYYQRHDTIDNSKQNKKMENLKACQIAFHFLSAAFCFYNSCEFWMVQQKVLLCKVECKLDFFWKFMPKDRYVRGEEKKTFRFRFIFGCQLLSFLFLLKENRCIRVKFMEVGQFTWYSVLCLCLAKQFEE